MIAWLKLLRLPNVFTAAADVMMGYLVTHGDLQPAERFGLLLAASCLLYLSGIVLNDVFDAEVDARERPDRPIPAGRVSWRTARSVGWTLLASGLLFAWIASYVANDSRPGAVATLLAACILLYDSLLKRTPAAPLLMGACRMLNVLLGMSLAVPRPVIVPSIRELGKLVSDSQPSWDTHQWLIALGLGTYIIGVTIFARTDARTSSRRRLIAGLLVLLAGVAIVAAAPAIDAWPPLVVKPIGWYLLWIVLALVTARRCILAILQPIPQRVQAAVRHCVHSIIVLDAAVCVGYAGPYWGLAVLLLIFPTLLLTLWLDAT